MLVIRLFLCLAGCVSMAKTTTTDNGPMTFDGDTIAAQTQFELFTHTPDSDTTSSDENQTNVGAIIVSPKSGGPDREHHVDFGSVVSLDQTGQFMLVGAPNFTYVLPDEIDVTKLIPRPAVNNVTTTSTQEVYCNECGAVFLYELQQKRNSSEMSWTRILSMTGHVQENLGKYIHLHPNGQSWAVRRGDGTVETFAITADGGGGARRFGSAISNCAGYHVQLTGDFLVVSCEMRNDRIGTVDIYEYALTNIIASGGGDDNNTAGMKDDQSDADLLDWIWRATVPLKGNEAPGTRLGWKIALDDKPTRGKLLRLAISAPLWQENTGLVRVYELDSDFQLHQLGPDLAGNNVGDKFGFGLAMSRRQTSKPILAIGMPGFGTEGIPDRGAVEIYEYSRYQRSWVLRGHFVGSTANTEDRLGRALSMSRDGRLVAVCSNRAHTFAGSVTLYQRVNDTTYVVAQELVGQSERDSFGTDVALNEVGSILVSGAIKEKNDEGISVGSVHTFLDQSPFCSLPKDNFHPREHLLKRPLCLDRSSLILTAEACQAHLELSGNENTPVTCVWKDNVEDANVNAAPSPVATVAPTGTVLETLAPSPPADMHVDILLVACLCNSKRECTTMPLTFDNPLILCVTTDKDNNGMNVELLSVSRLQLDQGNDGSDSNSVIVMDETGVHVPGARSSCEGNVCQIHCPMDSTLFFESGQDSLLASGTILINHHHPDRHHLVHQRSNIRILNNDGDVPDTALFTTNITLATRLSQTDNNNYDDGDELASTSSNLWIVLACFVGLMICCCLGLLKLKSSSPAPKNKSVVKRKNKPSLKSLQEQTDGLE